MTSQIRVIVNGVNGHMGQESKKAIEQDSELELVAALDKGDNLTSAIEHTSAQVVVDFTTPAVVFENTTVIIDSGAHPVIGTTGLTSTQIKELQALCLKKKLGGLIAPNFSIGAVLMMKFSKDIAPYFPDVEIIEMHHDGKKDAPSGTSIKTAEIIAQNRVISPKKNEEEKSLIGARGAKQNDIPIHSIRLPGLVAHQQVIFGKNGETLTIRHDSIHRECFMPGVLLACKKVITLDKLVYGLDEIV